MNEEAIQVLKEAMEPPEWWTNHARMTAREVVRRLEERGFTVARTSDVRMRPTASAPTATSTAAADEPSRERGLSALMANLESSIAAVRGSRDAAADVAASDEERASA